MGVDLVAIGLVGLFVLVGYWTGFIRQILKLACLAIAYLLARALASPLSAPTASLTGLCPPLATVAACGFVFLVLILVLGLFAGLIAKKYRKHEEARAVDNILGAFVGGLKGALIIYAAACLLALFGTTTVRGSSTLRAWQEESNIMRFAAQNNLLKGFEVVDSLTALAEIASDKDKLARLALDPRFHQLKELTDPKVVAALRNNDLLSVCSMVDAESLLKRVTQIIKSTPRAAPQSVDAGASAGGKVGR
ncbi:MAG: CvpA family protein [Deltaproteobacteria bacterium]|nr:CvpA family protein [Deltaproteobacteria bacterium]